MLIQLGGQYFNGSFSSPYIVGPCGGATKEQWRRCVCLSPSPHTFYLAFLQGSRVRRDTLLKIQQEAQERWAEQKVFEVEAPEEADPDNKYFANFPYPYMNGLLHLGHAFTISKVST
jgi:hypothetical protein